MKHHRTQPRMIARRALTAAFAGLAAGDYLAGKPADFALHALRALDEAGLRVVAMTAKQAADYRRHTDETKAAAAFLKRERENYAAGIRPALD